MWKPDCDYNRLQHFHDPTVDGQLHSLPPGHSPLRCGFCSGLFHDWRDWDRNCCCCNLLCLKLHKDRLHRLDPVVAAAWQKCCRDPLLGVAAAVHCLASFSYRCSAGDNIGATVNCGRAEVVIAVADTARTCPAFPQLVSQAAHATQEISLNFRQRPTLSSRPF